LHYLRNERGLAKNSVLVYAPFVRCLLVDQVAKTSGVSVDAFDATSIRTFLLERIHGRSAEYARLLATALKSFFRFLFLCGDRPTDLSASIPTVCKPRRTAVPAFLSPEEIDRVIVAIDRSTLTGRRDHAVLLLLARLGLRAGEIVFLELDDIHWRIGEIVIRGENFQRKKFNPLEKLREL
jgi:site-specific recombinase XerD